MNPDWVTNAGVSMAEAARRVQALFPSQPSSGPQIGFSPGDPDAPRPEPAAQTMGAEAVLAGQSQQRTFEEFPPFYGLYHGPDVGFNIEQDPALNRGSNYGILGNCWKSIHFVYFSEIS